MTFRASSNQTLLNYFDSKLVRTRNNPYSIDAQLMNLAGQALDDANFRYNRELKGLKLPYCPTGIDNNGVYFSFKLDASYPLASNATSLTSLSATNLEGTVVELSPYDDTLPVPAGYELDSNRSSVQIANPIIYSFTGNSNLVVLSADLNLTMPIVNRLSFWLDNLNIPNAYIDVCVSGIKYPVSPWDTNPPIQTESLQLTQIGYAETLSAWISISNITVRNLPQGATLDCHSIGFNLPASYDYQRPAVLSDFINKQFKKYWQVNSSACLIQESYMLDNLSGLVYYQSYNLSNSMNCICVEPNTWGGLVGGGTNLFYFDRREPLPNLQDTGLTQEPCYGLSVFYDVSRVGTNRSIIIQPVPYGNAGLVSKYRYIVTDPNSNQFVLLSDGSYLPYLSNNGWQSGAPNYQILPLTIIGQYYITLECIDNSGNLTYDLFPYNNFDYSDIVKATYDLSDLVINIQSIAYDFLGNLWIYDGLWTIPIKPYYNGYVLDPIGRTVYLTEIATEVTYT